MQVRTGRKHVHLFIRVKNRLCGSGLKKWSLRWFINCLLKATRETAGMGCRNKAERGMHKKIKESRRRRALCICFNCVCTHRKKKRYCAYYVRYAFPFSLFRNVNSKQRWKIFNLLSHSSLRHTRVSIKSTKFLRIIYFLNFNHFSETISVKYLFIGKDRCLFYRVGLSFCIVSIATWSGVKWTRV